MGHALQRAGHARERGKENYPHGYQILCRLAESCRQECWASSGQEAGPVVEHRTRLGRLLELSSWRTELVVARLGAQMMEMALGAYPQSVEEDEALLGGEFEDPRVRFMVMLRRDEKLVLHG